MFKRLQRWFGIGVILVILMLVLAVPVWAASGDGGSVTGIALALVIAGAIAPYLTQVLKKLFGDLEALPALWMSFAVAVLVSFIALTVTGELGWTAPPSEPIAAATWFLQFVGSVFGMATLVYKLLIKRPKPKGVDWAGD